LQVNNKAEADFILGTCHKAKGTEEDYMQLADDFVPISEGMNPSQEVDEYNLVYVAATRAKLALVCNKDLQQILLRADEMRLLQLEVCACVGGG
jgi:superfamily I DNA/RNA helicase